MAGIRLELNPRPLEKGAADARRALKGVGAEAGRTERDLKGLESQMDRDGAAASRLAGKRRNLSKALAGNSFAMRQMGLQLSQVGQQSMATGNFIQALAVQLPDIGLAFGTIGIAAGLLAGVTLPLLTSAFGGVRSETENLRISLDGLGDALDRARTANDLLSGSGDRLVRVFGGQAERAQRIVEIQKQLALVQAERAFSKAADTAATAFGAGEIKSLDDLESRIQTLKNAYIALEGERAHLAEAYASGKGALDDEVMALNFNINVMKQIIAESSDLQKVSQSLADQFGITRDSAMDLLVPLRDLAEADTIEDQVAAAEALALAINRASDGMGGSTDDAQELYDALLDAVESGLQFEALDMASPITAAADEAGRLATNIAAAAAAESGVGLDAFGGFGDFKYGTSSRFVPTRTRASGGGGGGSSAGGDRTRQAYESLISSLDPAIAAELRFAKAQKTVNDALRAGKITTIEASHALDLAKQAYDEATASASSFKSEVADIADSISSDIGQAMMDMVTRTKTVGEAFRAMATDIVRELYRVIVVQRAVAAIKTVITNISGAFAPAAPSFAGGGYTGNAPRSGGVDGQGGFMAVLHPRETVVDHTKARASGGGPKIVINQTFTGGVTREDLGNAVPRIVDASKAAVLDAMRRHQGGF